MNEYIGYIHNLEDKDAIGRALSAELARARALRERAQADADLRDARTRLRAWQAARLARSYADLLASPRFAPAAHFFLCDLYGPRDCSARDQELARVVPTLVATLPAAALRTLALAVGMDAVSEELDAAMAAALHQAGRIETMDEAAYAAAYRQCERRAQRELQIALVGEIGRTLERLTRKPLIATALRLMRKPAHAAGLGELQTFLERGFAAFKHMGDAQEFLQRIESGERAVLERLFAGGERPFALT